MGRIKVQIIPHTIWMKPQITPRRVNSFIWRLLNMYSSKSFLEDKATFFPSSSFVSSNISASTSSQPELSIGAFEFENGNSSPFDLSYSSSLSIF
jgi:hypothetical protein